MDWFSMDTDIFEDGKIKDLLMLHSGDGFTIYAFILANVARNIDIDNDKNGYFDIGEKDPVERISWEFHADEEYVQEILDDLSNLGLIDKKKWEDKNEIYVPKILERQQTKIYLKQQEAGRVAGKQSGSKGSNKDSNQGTFEGSKKVGAGPPETDVDVDKDVDKDIDKEQNNTKVKSYNDFSKLDRKNKMGWVINKLPDGFFDEPWGLVGKWLNDFKHKTVYLGIKSINSKNGWAKIKNDYEGNEAGYIFKVLQSKQEELEENDGKTDFEKELEGAV